MYGQSDQSVRSGLGLRGAWGAVAVVFLIGVHLLRGGLTDEPADGPPRPAPAAAPLPARAEVTASRAAPPAPAPLPAAPPVRVRVPAVGVDAPVARVGLEADGRIAAPPPGDRNLAGWFTGSVTPGARGTAVVVGHVDTAEGHAVFYDLGALAKGQRIEIARADGRTAVFTVYGVELVPKDRFPAERVYGSTSAPELRLITCGGPYAEGGGYTDNVVVSARLAEVR
ncbi:class F sortase [Streptomyces sp. NPDC046203]|uniref:class F sortase n=1 Tax=Streptomyces sp. NPDC046203 TaxID=3154602 RepID=UPI0033DE2A83